MCLFALAFIEIRAINGDRDARDIAQKNALQEEGLNFGAIGKGIEQSINQGQLQFQATMQSSQQQFDATMSKVGTVLGSVTGGNSFAYLMPQPTNPVSLVVWNHGDKPLTGVSIVVAHTSAPVPEWGSELFRPIPIGTIAPHGYLPFPVFISPTPEAKNGIDNYWIFISAQNGTVQESLRFRKPKNGTNPWAYSFEVTKQRVLSKKEGSIPKGAIVNQPLLVEKWSDEVGMQSLH